MSANTNNERISSKSHLLEESILPVRSEERVISLLGYFFIWTGMVVMIVAYQFGAVGIESHTMPATIMAIYLGYLAIGFVMLFSADIGTEHGLSFAVYLRATFGIYGVHVPAVSRGTVAAIWFGIQTYLGALALNGIFEFLTGFDNWFAWYLIFGVVQVFNTALGIKAVERFAKFASPILIIISIWMFFFLQGIAELEGHNIWTFAGSGNFPLFLVFMMNFQLWAALAVDIPNITRFLKVENSRSFFIRNKGIFAAQLIALPIVSTFLATIGAVAWIATGEWNPILIIQDYVQGAGLVVLLALIVLAQWSTNNAANLIPAALAYVNAGAPRIPYWLGVVLGGIVGTVVMPWWILDQLFFYIGIYGGTLSAVAGIMFCDYYLIRKRRLNVPDLYKENGQFRYNRGFNVAGLIAWVAASVLAIWNLNYAYLVGLPCGIIFYYVLMKFWYMKKFPQVEVTSGYDDQYLATTVAKEWAFVDQQFCREDCVVKSTKRSDM